MWDFVNSHRPLSETPSPKKDEPKDDSSKSLKDGLLLCKSRLLQLNVKLKNLSSKLLVLKKNLIEEAKPLPDFVNTDEWWVKAIANSGKITEAHKTKILEKFEKIKNLSIGNVSKLYTTIFSLYKAKDYKERVSMLGFVKKGVQERAIKILNLEKLAELSDKIFKENSDDEKFLNWLVG